MPDARCAAQLELGDRERGLALRVRSRIEGSEQACSLRLRLPASPRRRDLARPLARGTARSARRVLARTTRPGARAGQTRLALAAPRRCESNEVCEADGDRELLLRRLGERLRHERRDGSHEVGRGLRWDATQQVAHEAAVGDARPERELASVEDEEVARRARALEGDRVDGEERGERRALEAAHDVVDVAEERAQAVSFERSRGAPDARHPHRLQRGRGAIGQRSVAQHARTNLRRLAHDLARDLAELLEERCLGRPRRRSALEDGAKRLGRESSEDEQPRRASRENATAVERNDLEVGLPGLHRPRARSYRRRSVHPWLSRIRAKRRRRHAGGATAVARDRHGRGRRPALALSLDPRRVPTETTTAHGAPILDDHCRPHAARAWTPQE